MEITKKLHSQIDKFNTCEKNQKFGVPKFEEFIQAFEMHIGHGNFKVDVWEHNALFTVKGKAYLVDTYQGRSALLDRFVETRSYSELYTETESGVWGEICADPGISKAQFLPAMHQQWEIFWNEKESRLGNDDHFKKLKEESWRKLQIFNSSYDESDAIRLAYDIDDVEFIPLAILAMLECYDKETCYFEYCEFTLEEPEYESVVPNESDDEEQEVNFFYIRHAEEFEE
jgi:hypothetical protein